MLLDTLAFLDLQCICLIQNEQGILASLSLACRSAFLHSRSNQFASACFLFVSRPPAQVESRRLVTAGHGPVTSGLPVRGHACHAQSRRCRWGHGRHGVGPAARTPTARHVAHGSLTCASGGRSLCGALPAWSARAPRRCASLRTRPRRDHGVASSIQNVPRPESGPLFCCWAVVATPHPVPGSCPGGSQAIGQ